MFQNETSKNVDRFITTINEKIFLISWCISVLLELWQKISVLRSEIKNSF